MKLPFTLAVACGLMTASIANSAIDDDAAQAILKKGGCTNCHKLDKTLVGPSIIEIAKKHRGQATAADHLKKAVRGGSNGTYAADSAMPGNSETKISDADLTSLVQWILAQ